MKENTQQDVDRAVCVYCASSRACHPDYHEAAYRLGVSLADGGYAVVYGGGAVGSMGALADGALSRGGRVIGVLPHFMNELEWGRRGLSELQLVEDMHIRKQTMLARSQAAVALPGGSGTLDELLEAISLKRLGIFLGPIVMVNTRHFFDPLIELLSRAIEERFMSEQHGRMWQVVATPEEVIEAFASAPQWSIEARKFAVR